MKQFDVNLVWSQMRQTLKAPVARRRLEAPTASRTPAASGHGALPEPDLEPAPRACGARTLHPTPCFGETEARCLGRPGVRRRPPPHLGIPFPRETREAPRQRAADTALPAVGGSRYKPERRVSPSTRPQSRPAPILKHPCDPRSWLPGPRRASQRAACVAGSPSLSARESSAVTVAEATRPPTRCRAPCCPPLAAGSRRAPPLT